jgi:fructokinase
MRIGVDIGGTKIEAIALAPDGGILFRERLPTPRSYQGTLDAVAALIGQLERETGLRGPVGVGIPGTISPATGLVKNANSVWLNGRPFDRDLSDRLARPLRMTNDANCFALSEAVDGAGAGASSVFGVILGTGVGGGIVLEGRVLEGASGIAGEWGHNPLPWPSAEELPGPKCFCGLAGCVETFCSGPGMERDHSNATGESASAEEIAERGARGDPVARATLSRHADRLTRSLAIVLNVLDPEVVVLGGGLSNIPDLAANVQRLLPRYVFTDQVATRVVINVHGDSSGVRGAAWLWPEESAR